LVGNAFTLFPTDYPVSLMKADEPDTASIK